MHFSFWPFLWFGLPGRLLKNAENKTKEISKKNKEKRGHEHPLLEPAKTKMGTAVRGQQKKTSRRHKLHDKLRHVATVCDIY